MNFEELLKSGFAPSQDSRNVKKGEIYFCLTDDEVKTRERVAEALKRGAEFAVSNFDLGERCIKVADAREDFALFCKNFYKSACDEDDSGFWHKRKNFNFAYCRRNAKEKRKEGGSCWHKRSFF